MARLCYVICLDINPTMALMMNFCSSGPIHVYGFRVIFTVAAYWEGYSADQTGNLCFACCHSPTKSEDNAIVCLFAV